MVERVLACSTPAEVIEARARIEAAKAWAKVHRQTRALRLDLLKLEVAALVRLFELEAVDMLPVGERAAAEWLGGMTATERDVVVESNQAVTSAVGLCRAVWRDREQEREREAARLRGRTWAAAPPAPSAAPAKPVEPVRSLEETLGGLLSEYTTAGIPFTIEEVADALLDRMGVTVDDEFRAGVHEIVRLAVRSAKTTTIDGTRIPKTITARLPDGGFIRISTVTATVAHLDDAVAFKEEQLQQDTAKLAEFRAFVNKVKAIDGASPQARVGHLIARSLEAHENGVDRYLAGEQVAS